MRTPQQRIRKASFMPLKPEARAIEAHYERTGIHAEVFKGEYLGLYSTEIYLRDHDPLISIIIRTRTILMI